MLNWWNSLSGVWKIVIIVVAIILAVLIYDGLTSSWRNVDNWLFDRQQAKIEAENAELLKQNEVLRKSAEENARKAEESRIREEALIAQAEQKGIEIAKVQEETAKALEEVRKEEEITAQPTDAKTRCIRVKQKLEALNIKSAREINCEEFNQ